MGLKTLRDVPPGHWLYFVRDDGTIEHGVRERWGQNDRIAVGYDRGLSAMLPEGLIVYELEHQSPLARERAQAEIALRDQMWRVHRAGLDKTPWHDTDTCRHCGGPIVPAIKDYRAECRLRCAGCGDEIQVITAQDIARAWYSYGAWVGRQKTLEEEL